MQKPSHRIAALLSVLFFLAIVFTYPLALHMNDSFVSNIGDLKLNTWILCWPAHQLFTDPLSLYHGNNFFPARNSLAFSDNMLSSTLLVLPVFAITKNPALVYNSLIFVSLLLSGLGMYLLANRLTGSPYAAATAAILYCFSATRMERVSQIQLFTAHWIPFALFYLHRFLDKYTFRDLVLFTLFFVLQALAGAYNTVYLVTAVAIAIPFFVIAHRKYKDIEFYKKLALLGVISAVILLPFFWPYLENARTYGMVRREGVISKFSPDFRAYLAIPTNFYLWLSDRFGLRAYLFSEAPFLFPGIVPLVLAGIGIRKMNKTKIYYIIVAVFALVASTGSKLHLYDFLYDHLLLFKMTRVPSRFMLLFVLCISVLSAYGTRALLQRYQETHKRLYAALVVILPLLFLIESYTGPLQLFKRPENREVYRWLANESPGTVVTELPFANPYNSGYMLSSVAHWQVLTNGYSGYTPPSYHEMKGTLDEFPSRTAIRKLYETTDYLILHTDLLETERAQQTLQKLTEFRDRLEPWKRFDKDFVYRLKMDVRDVVFRRYYTATALKNQDLSVRLKVAEEHPQLQQYISILINDTLLHELPLDKDFQKHELTIPSNDVQRGPNRLTFLYAYKRPQRADANYGIGTTKVLSPVDLIVESSGAPSGSRARIIVNGRNVSVSRRGYNIVVIHPESGKVDGSEGFDPTDQKRLREFLNGVPPGKIVVIAARGDVSSFGNPETIAAFQSIGAQTKNFAKPGASHIVIGVKGAAPGQAVEMTSDILSRLVIGGEVKDVGFLLQDLTLTQRAR